VTYVSSSRVVLAVIVVVAACIGCAAAVEAARRSRNWLWLICALGMVAVVAGVVGQRAGAGGSDSTGQSSPGRSTGPWDAAVSLPGVGIDVTPVALGGFLLAAAGLSLVLYLEPAAGRRPAPQAAPRRLEDDDAV
jgi:hypothetical protein